MKKWLGAIAGILGIALVSVGYVLYKKLHTEYAVIGGADGPTAVFIAGRVNDAVFMIPIGIGVIALILIIFLLYKRRH